LMMASHRFYVFDVAVVALSVLALFVALAPVHSWGDRIPDGALRGLSCGAAFLLSLRGVAGLVADGVTDLVWWPMFLVGGLLFGAAAFLPTRGGRARDMTVREVPDLPMKE
jgi:hypothetical protein